MTANNLATDLGETPETRATQRTVAKSRPIGWCASIGAFFLALNVYIYGSWILSGEAKRVYPGVTPVPDYMRFFITAQKILFPLALLLMLVFIVIKPW